MIARTKIEKLRAQIEEMRLAYLSTKSQYLYRQFIKLQQKLAIIKKSQSGTQLKLK